MQTTSEALAKAPLLVQQETIAGAIHEKKTESALRNLAKILKLFAERHAVALKRPPMMFVGITYPP